MVARTTRPARGRRQRGAVLILGLVVLLVVTMIGISGQQDTVLQERLAGNMRQSNIAFQAAEAGLQVGLSYIEEQDLPITATDTGTHFVWTSCSVLDAETIGDPAPPNHPCKRLETVLTDWQQATVEISEGKPYGDVAAELDGAGGGTIEIPDVIAQPRIYIEAREEAVSPDAQANSFGQLMTYYYTVTSIGFGNNEQARVVLQSTIAKQVQQ
jgi:Tfp pilus assembly protein PilX